MWMSLVQSNLSRKPEKKGFNKIFLVAVFMYCEGKISGKLNWKLKFYKRVHFDYLLVFYLRDHFKMYVICLNRVE